MIRNFFSAPNVLGRLMIVMIFAGGLVFAGVFNGFVVETDAKSCCGGKVDAALLSSSGSNSGCTCINGTPCGDCDTRDCGGSKETSCYANCECSSGCSNCSSGTTVCKKDDDQACSSVCSSNDDD